MTTTTKWLIGILIGLILIGAGWFIFSKYIQKSKNTSTSETTTTQTQNTNNSTAATTNLLSLDNLKNATYKIDGESFKMTNGESADARIMIDTDHIAYNNGSATNSDKAAVIVIDSRTDTGSNYYLEAIGIENSQPVYLASKLIDDRAKIHSVEMNSNNIITVSATIHTETDPACCPTLEKTLNYQLTSDNKLVAQ
jgi:hypothetical protein